MGKSKRRKRSKQKTIVVGRKRKSIKSRKIKNKKLGVKQAVSRIKKHVRGGKLNTVGDAIKLSLKSAISIRKKIRPTRIVNFPKMGGILPLIPLLAGLSALRTLSGGAAAKAKAVNSTKSAKEQLEEAKRHNKSMEAIALGKGL